MPKKVVALKYCGVPRPGAPSQRDIDIIKQMPSLPHAIYSTRELANQLNLSIMVFRRVALRNPEAFAPYRLRNRDRGADIWGTPKALAQYQAELAARRGEP